MYLWTTVLTFGTVFIGLERTWWAVAIVIAGLVMCVLLTMANSWHPAADA